MTNKTIFETNFLVLLHVMTHENNTFHSGIGNCGPSVNSEIRSLTPQVERSVNFDYRKGISFETIFRGPKDMKTKDAIFGKITMNVEEAIPNSFRNVVSEWIHHGKLPPNAMRN